MSYFGSQDFLKQATMDMLMGDTTCDCSDRGSSRCPYNQPCGGCKAHYDSATAVSIGWWPTNFSTPESGTLMTRTVGADPPGSWDKDSYNNWADQQNPPKPHVGADECMHHIQPKALGGSNDYGTNCQIIAKADHCETGVGHNEKRDGKTFNSQWTNYCNGTKFLP